jgi:hypothetical protein
MLSTVVLPAAARAQPTQATFDGSTIHCESFEGCGEGCSSAEACVKYGPDEMEGCVASLHPFVCCASDEDCLFAPVEGGAVLTGVCEYTHPSTGLCVFERPSTFCSEILGAAASVIVGCMTQPDGTPAASWAGGDCDDDGAPNGEELVAGCDPCDVEEAPGGGCGDPPIDGGGPGARDAGSAGELDGGGSGGLDASLPKRDAGHATGPSPGAQPGFRFHGGGCALASPSRPLGDGAAGLVVLLAARWRRRRSGR